MASARDERRLFEVRNQIEALYAGRSDDFNLPLRYDALVKLERSLIRRVSAPRRERTI